MSEDNVPGYKNGGLDQYRYNIKKADGDPVDGSDYFVLKADTDPHARRALGVYAASVYIDNPRLALEIQQWLNRLQRDHPIEGE